MFKNIFRKKEVKNIDDIKVEISLSELADLECIAMKYYMKETSTLMNLADECKKKHDFDGFKKFSNAGDEAHKNTEEYMERFFSNLKKIQVITEQNKGL